MSKKKREHKHTQKKFRSISEVKEAFCSPAKENRHIGFAYWKKSDPLDKVENPFANKKPSSKSK